MRHKLTPCDTSYSVSPDFETRLRHDVLVAIGRFQRADCEEETAVLVLLIGAYSIGSAITSAGRRMRKAVP
jgi:hypothetical protein